MVMAAAAAAAVVMCVYAFWFPVGVGCVWIMQVTWAKHADSFSSKCWRTPFLLLTQNTELVRACASERACFTSFAMQIGGTKQKRHDDAVLMALRRFRIKGVMNIVHTGT